jgi:hypothetical protein
VSPREGPRARREPAEFTPVARPARYPLMEPRACFRNAFLTATASPELLYGEGYALWPVDSEQGIWVHHAWVIDPARNAVDVTWAAPGQRYVGIAVSPDELMEAQLRKHRNSDLAEPVLATRLSVAPGIAEVTWELAEWFTGRCPGPVASEQEPDGGPEPGW